MKAATIINSFSIICLGVSVLEFASDYPNRTLVAIETNEVAK